jgi:hypothetical protein
MRVYGLPSCTLFVERTLGHAVAAPAMKGILSGIIQTVGSFGFVAESTGAFTAVFPRQIAIAARASTGLNLPFKMTSRCCQEASRGRR